MAWNWKDFPFQTGWMPSNSHTKPTAELQRGFSAEFSEVEGFEANKSFNYYLDVLLVLRITG